MKAFIIFIALFLHSCEAQLIPDTISEIWTKTGDDGMGVAGSIQIEIWNVDDISCWTNSLNNLGNNFQPNTIDKFGRLDISDCYDFEVDQLIIPKLVIHHSGLDSWFVEYVRVVMKSGQFLECTFNQSVDGSGTLENLSCFLP